jgi:hypothetical protein
MANVVVLYRETRIVKLDEDVEITEETSEGITVRHTYRKGVRLEFIPRSKLESIIYEDEKPARKPRKAKAAAPTPKPVVEPVVEEPVVPVEDTGDKGIYSEDDTFDDSGDEFDDDDDDFE